MIGDPDAEKKAPTLVAIHVHEYITTSLATRQVWGMLDQKMSGEIALDDVCIQFVPMANPSGV